jgi:hypothetical protein
LESLIDRYSRDIEYSCKYRELGCSEYVIIIHNIQCEGCGHESPTIRVDKKTYDDTYQQYVPKFLGLSIKKIRKDHKKAQRIRRKIKREDERQEKFDTISLNEKMNSFKNMY